MIKTFILTFLFICFSGLTALFAQIPVNIDDEQPHHIFKYDQIDVFEDVKNNKTFADVSDPSFQNSFVKNQEVIPKNRHAGSVYWFRFRIHHSQNSVTSWILEFFDQSITNMELYVPDEQNHYKFYRYGTIHDFEKRPYLHKNFTFDLKNNSDKVLTYYLKLKAPHSVSAIIVLRDLRFFVGYALKEYFLFGLFYGMIIVFGFYNLLMFFVTKKRQYLFYVLYNVSIGLYEMCNDGIAFQYLWPSHPELNVYGFGIALFSSTVFGLLFTINFLFLKYKAPKFYKLLWALIGLRTVFFIFSLFYPSLFNFKVLEILPLAIALSAGIYVLKQGYKPATFLVVGYSFLFFGFFLKILLLLRWISYNPLSYYSLSFCFVIEMILVSFAIGSSIRTLRRKKDLAQKRIIDELQINHKLNQTLNEELNVLVEERTKDLKDKAEIIEKQNQEISLMLSMLKKDNTELHVNIEKVTRARVMSKQVDFSEFSKVYPDKESCFDYIAGLKWSKGYACKKCENPSYLTGQTYQSRRCTKCGYDESVIAYTTFQNSRIPINKALYMLFLVYSSKGTISSYKLSQILMIRQSTCWTYNSRMQKMLIDRKDEIKHEDANGWSRLVLDDQQNG
jgi:hypothetical protein